MADAHALGACGENRAGSSPASPTRSRQNWKRFARVDAVLLEMGFIATPARRLAGLSTT